MNLYISRRNGSVNRVGGVKVSIVAFQAIDPGSIPGWRSFLVNSFRTAEGTFVDYLQVVA